MGYFWAFPQLPVWLAKVHLFVTCQLEDTIPDLRCFPVSDSFESWLLHLGISEPVFLWCLKRILSVYIQGACCCVSKVMELSELPQMGRLQ